MEESIDTTLTNLEKPVGFGRKEAVASVREELGSRQNAVEEIADNLLGQVEEVKKLVGELAKAKQTELIPDGKKANELFNDGEFRQRREEIIHAGEALMGKPVFGENGYLAKDFNLREQSTWRGILATETYGSKTQRENLLNSTLREKLEEIPPEARRQLCELYKFAFAESVVLANEGDLKDAEITTASKSMQGINEYLEVAPISRKVFREITNEILITADGGLSAVARGHFSKK